MDVDRWNYWGIAMTRKQVKLFAIACAAASVVGVAFLFTASIAREELTCFDANGEVVYKDSKYVLMWQYSPQGKLEKHCADHGYDSAGLVVVDCYGLHKITYFYGWKAMPKW